MSLLFPPGHPTQRDHHGEYVLRTGRVTEVTKNLASYYYRVTVFLGHRAGEEWLGHVTAFSLSPPKDAVGMLATVRIYKKFEDCIDVDLVLKWEAPYCPTVWERLEAEDSGAMEDTLNNVKLRGRSCYRRKTGTALPDSHPDAWETLKVPESARAAICFDRTVIGGRDFFLFREESGQVWAMNAILWAAAEGGPSNRDPEQEKLHEEPL